MNISLWDIRKLFVKTLGAVAIVISALNPIVRKRLMLTKKGFLLCKVCFFAYITSITHHNAVKDSLDVASFLDQAQYIQNVDDADLGEQSELRKLP